MLLIISDDAFIGPCHRVRRDKSITDMVPCSRKGFRGRVAIWCPFPYCFPIVNGRNGAISSYSDPPAIPEEDTADRRWVLVATARAEGKIFNVALRVHGMLSQCQPACCSRIYSVDMEARAHGWSYRLRNNHSHSGDTTKPCWAMRWPNRVTSYRMRCWGSSSIRSTA